MEYFDTALLVDCSVDNGSVATLCVGVGGGVSGVSGRHSMSMDVAVLSVVGNRECCTRRIICTQLFHSTAVSTVDQLPPCVPLLVAPAVDQLPARVSMSVKVAVVSVDGSRECCRSTLMQRCWPTAVSTVDWLPPRVCRCRWRLEWCQWTAVKSAAGGGAHRRRSAGRL